eukprot:6080983-Alexandrium_andersonii.AAC.1
MIAHVDGLAKDQLREARAKGRQALAEALGHKTKGLARIYKLMREDPPRKLAFVCVDGSWSADPHIVDREAIKA